MRPNRAHVWCGRCALALGLACVGVGLSTVVAADVSLPAAGIEKPATQTPANDPLTAPPSATTPHSVANLYAAFAPAVVRVKLVDEEVDAEGKNIVYFASGFLISDDGLVLTSLGQAPRARIQRVIIDKDGLDYAAQLIGADLRTTLALVRLLRMPEKFAVIPIDAPNVTLPIGSPVLAISMPLEFDASPSAGIATGYESGFAQYVFPCSYMRTSIPLGPAEQGAPVLDAAGLLAGVMVGSLTDLRSSYVVAPNSLRRIVSDLKTHGRVIYGTLPVEFAETPDKPYVARQVVVASIQAGSRAEQAGLRPGDVLRRLTLRTNRKVELPASLTSLGDNPIRRISHVRDMLFHALPGEDMRIEVERDGQAIPFFTLPVEALVDAPRADEGNASVKPAGAEEQLPATSGDPPLSR